MLLLTATPMQVAPIEVWDLLNLLGLPEAWTAERFLQFFEDIGHPNPGHDALVRSAQLFRAAEAAYGRATTEQGERIGGLSKVRAGKMLRALRNERTHIQLRRLENDERAGALALLRSWTAGSPPDLATHAASCSAAISGRACSRRRSPSARSRTFFVHMTPAESALYDAVDDYISSTYDRSDPNVRNAVGFVMTVYRRRLASSFHALAQTLRNRLAGLDSSHTEGLFGNEEDASDDETTDLQDADEVKELELHALRTEERDEISALLQAVEALPPDSKLAELAKALDSLRADGYAQVMVFTQYTDTMDFLRDQLLAADGLAPHVLLRTGWRSSDRGRRVGADLPRRGQAAVPRGRGRCAALHGCGRRGPETSSSAGRW